MRDKRHWLVRLLVIVLLLGAFVTWKLISWTLPVGPASGSARGCRTS
ncbi:MAG: hypothetical protein R2709_01065 [Marmoricola sp.]